ncbi:AMP-dependent synthetase and ligase [Phlyctochytrium arcticum]|nr:AMP-dependent synthetase and ligase [Phlyctochytrium arcticum]
MICIKHVRRLTPCPLKVRLLSTRTLPSLPLFEAAESAPTRTAIVSKGHEYAYGQLLEDALNVKTQLHQRTTSKDRRIAFLQPRSYEYVASQWGIWAAGLTAVPLCTSHPAPELAYTITDSQSDTVLYHPAFAEQISRLRKEESVKAVKFIELSDMPRSWRANGGEALETEDISLDTPAQIIYTSGTTGKPKGVLTTHANTAAQIESLVQAWKWTNKDRILHVLPLHHVHGVINALTCPLHVGATCEFLDPFNAEAVWARWMDPKQDLTVFMAVPTIYSKLISAYRGFDAEKQTRARKSCQQFRLMVSGSAALPESIFAEWEEISGHRLLERYGMTEIGMALGNPYDGPRIPGTVGHPFPQVQTRILSEDHRPILDPDVSGELYIKGPQVFREYWNKPEATRKEMDEDGWFKTGDIVSVDKQGVYRILGRASVDIIKTGGFKVSALDIEREILEHKSVHDVAVLGLPSEEWGEIVAAMIVPQPGQTLTGEELKTFLHARLAPYKIPKKWKFVNELPRNAMGKVNKKGLKGLF